jgi:hypothetical protein
LTTNISLDEATCDLNLVISVAEFFGIATDEAKTIVKEVATATVTWREVATAFGATRAEIRRMSSAFEHDDLARTCALRAAHAESGAQRALSLRIGAQVQALPRGFAASERLSTSSSDPVIHVVAVAVIDAVGRVLIAQRPAGKHLAGGWEFPCGKLEPGEERLAGLERELREELGISIIGTPRAPDPRAPRLSVPGGAALYLGGEALQRRGAGTGRTGTALVHSR